MFPFDNTNFSSSNFGGFNFNGFSSGAKSTYHEFDNNNFAGNWSGAVETRPSHPMVELDPFGLPGGLPTTRSQEPIPGPSYWNPAGPYEGSVALDTAPDTVSNFFETMFPPVSGLPGTGKSHRRNLGRFVRS